MISPPLPIEHERDRYSRLERTGGRPASRNGRLHETNSSSVLLTVRNSRTISRTYVFETVRAGGSTIVAPGFEVDGCTIDRPNTEKVDYTHMVVNSLGPLRGWQIYILPCYPHPRRISDPSVKTVDGAIGIARRRSPRNHSNFRPDIPNAYPKRGGPCETQHGLPLCCEASKSISIERIGLVVVPTPLPARRPSRPPPGSRYP